MALSKPWSTLCLLSLSLPALSFASPFWFFSSAPDSTCSKGSCNKTEHHKENVCEGNCPVPCDVKPCCKTETYTDVITICENPCRPSHCNWEVALSFGVGYRYDRLKQRYHTDADDVATGLKSKYNNINSVISVVRFDARAYNFMFGIEGDYSFLVNGHLKQHVTVPTSPASDSEFHFHKLNGYEADIMADVGYRLEFMGGRREKAYFIPTIGYRYSHQAYEAYSQKVFQNPHLVGVTQIMQDQSPMHSEWYGPYLEAKFSFVFWDKLFINPFYQYHFLDYRAREKMALTTINTGVALGTSQEIAKTVFRNDSARGQSAGLDMYWQFDNGVRLGAKGSWLEFQTRDGKARTKQDTFAYTATPPVETTVHAKVDAKVTWTSYNAYLYVGYAF